MPLLGKQDELVSTWQQHARDFFKIPPTAIVMVSAHYEASTMQVGGAAQPPMIYDYGGFPNEAYSFKYPAKGDLKLADRAVSLLQEAGIEAAVDSDRGFDHGVFIPLMSMFPKANIPVVPISVLFNQSPQAHVAVGAALSSLRDEGVLVLGSGSSSHVFSKMMGAEVHGQAFNEHLEEVLTDGQWTLDQQLAALEKFDTMPGAAEAQTKGRAEHLMPLFTVLGTSKYFQKEGDDGRRKSSQPPKVVFNGIEAFTNTYQMHVLCLD